MRRQDESSTRGDSCAHRRTARGCHIHIEMGHIIQETSPLSHKCTQDGGEGARTLPVARSSMRLLGCRSPRPRMWPTIDMTASDCVNEVRLSSQTSAFWGKETTVHVCGVE